MSEIQLNFFYFICFYSNNPLYKGTKSGWLTNNVTNKVTISAVTMVQRRISTYNIKAALVFDVPWSRTATSMENPAVFKLAKAFSIKTVNWSQGMYEYFLRGSKNLISSWLKLFSQDYSVCQTAKGLENLLLHLGPDFSFAISTWAFHFLYA